MQLSNTEPTQNYMASAVLVADANDIPQEVTDRIQQQMADDVQLEEYRNSAPPPDRRPENGHGNIVPENELTIAARSGRTATVRKLIESSPAAVNERCGKGGQFALMHAAKLGHTGIVQALLEASASVDLLCYGGRSALMWAARNGHTSVVLALLQASASVDLQRPSKAGFSALMYAAWHGHTAIVQALLQANASVDLQSRLGYTALAVAAWNGSNGHTAIVQALLQASASVDLQTNGGHTALMVAAAKNGRTATVRLLLKAGAETSLRNTEGDSAETFASERNHAAIILLLQGKSLRTWPCTKVTFGLRAREARAARNRVSPATMVETMGPPCYL